MTDEEMVALILASWSLVCLVAMVVIASGVTP
jgi:hypothetical protein